MIVRRDGGVGERRFGAALPDLRPVVVAVLLLFLSPIGTASAQGPAGRLDRSFGMEGLASTSMQRADDTGPVEIGASSDGSTVVGDQGIFVRFRPDGSRDLEFGTKGELRLGADTAGEGIAAHTFLFGNMAVDGRGRIVVFGERTDRRDTYQPIGISALLPASAAVILRFNAKGKPDRGFGQGGGFAVEDFGLASEFPTDVPLVSALAGRVDSRGRPLLVAGTAGISGACQGHSFIGSQPRAIARLTQAGTLDASFAGDGVSLLGRASVFRGLEVNSAGRIVVAAGDVGPPKEECALGTTLIGRSQDGELLRGFGRDGVRPLGRLNLDVLSASGAVVLSRRQHKALSLRRLRTDGTRDLSFGANGAASLPMPDSYHVRPVAIDQRGRLLLAGFVGVGRSHSAEHRQRSGAFVVMRVLRNGTPDRRFGASGRILTKLPLPLQLTSAQAILDRQGRLLIAGTAIKPHRSGRGFVVARYALGP